MTKTKAIDELNHIIWNAPKEPPEYNDDMHWERDNKIYIESLEMAVKSIEKIEKIERIVNQHYKYDVDMQWDVAVVDMYRISRVLEGTDDDLCDTNPFKDNRFGG